MGKSRVILIAGLLVLVPVLLYHRIRSQATREKLDRRQEGLLLLLTLRPAGLVFLAALIVYILNPSAMAWSSMALPGKLRALGVGGGVLGSVLLIWTLRTLGANLTDTVVTRKTHMLVMHGPYLWVRHPLYVSVALLVLAVFLIASNWFFLLVGGAVLGLIYVRTRKEEELLLARFGDHYRAYMRRTGRFLPKLL
jgi:protein-S-isoprenylcysteine O-methyltransferase Ste14